MDPKEPTSGLALLECYEDMLQWHANICLNPDKLEKQKYAMPKQTGGVNDPIVIS
jgi:hypothetical protein